MSTYTLPGDVMKLTIPGYPNTGVFIKAIPEGAVIKTKKGLVAVAHGLYELDHHVEQDETIGGSYV